MKTIYLLITFILAYSPALVYGLIEVIKTGELYPDRNADFGPKLPADGLSGILIPIEQLDENKSNLGCTALKSPPVLKTITAKTYKNTGIEVPWIALVQRGECSFVQKVKAMQESGASGVIIGGNSVGGGLVRMFAPEEEVKGINIQSAYIMKWEYEKLLTIMSEQEDHTSSNSNTGNNPQMITKTATMPHLIIKMLPDGFDDWPLIDVTVIALFIPVIVILILWIIWKCKFGDESFFDDSEYDTIYLTPRHIPPHELPASIDAVNNLPKKIYQSKSRAINDPDICAICLDDFEDEEELRKLPCKHEFHIGCIDPWLLTRKRFCPVCKGDSCPVPDSDGSVVSHSNSNHHRSSSTSTTTSVSSDSSIILDPTPILQESVLINMETEPLLVNTTRNTQNNNNNVNCTSSGINNNGTERTPRNSLLSALSRTWRSTSSVLSNMSSTISSSPQRPRTPFPVADPDDYEIARRMALDNRRRRDESSRSNSTLNINNNISINNNNND